MTGNEIYRKILDKIGAVEWASEAFDGTSGTASLFWDDSENWWKHAGNMIIHLSMFEAHAIIDKAWRDWLEKENPHDDWIICHDVTSMSRPWYLYKWLGTEQVPTESGSYRTRPEAMLAAVDHVLSSESDGE